MRPLALAAVLWLLLVPTLPSAAPTDRPAAPTDPSPNRAYPVKILYKLARGLTNILSSPTEIPYNMVKEGRLMEPDEDWLVPDGGDRLVQQLMAGFTGFFTGIGYTVARIGIGIIDTVTFFVPTPPIMDPATPPSALDLALDSLPPTPQ